MFPVSLDKSKGEEKMGLLTQKGNPKRDNQETKEKLGTEQKRAIKNGQSRDTGNIWH
jgi:hypothetical protein